MQNSKEFVEALRSMIRAEIHYSKYCNPENSTMTDDCFELVLGILKTEVNKFIKPRISEITDYCIERKNKVDALAFYDFYESKCWMVGKNKMKCWKSAVRTWEKRSEKNQGSNQSKSRSVSERLQQISAADIRKNGFTNSLDN